MQKKTIKIVSLNLWRFYEWERRLPLIISLLKELQPDIIFTQETQLDPAFDKRNQVEILNEKLGYPHTYFARADIKTSRKGVPLPYPIDHGLGVFSKFAFNSEIVPLTKASDDKEQRILLKNDFDIDGNKFSFTNLHFSNSDTWAEAHFEETLKIFENRQIKSVLAGDFNISNIDKYKNLYEEQYISSSKAYDYTSYPKDGVSYDYILIPKEYSFTNFECRNEDVSDHRMIVATIKV